MSIFELWLPILAAGLGVHVASTIAWMALPHHKSEWPMLRAKDSLQGLIRGQEANHGQFMIAPEDGAENDPSACAGMLVMWKNPPNMGANVGMTVAMFMAISFVIGYQASMVLAPGAPFMQVFRFTFCSAFLVHVMGGVVHVIWFRRKLLMETLDGLAFSVITAAIYASLWPAAS